VKIWYDTEFIDDGRTIELISIGMVAEDGRELYAVNADMQFVRLLNHPWLLANVVPHLPRDNDPSWADGWLDYSHPDVRSREHIRTEVRKFLDDTPDAELWAYYGAYDHVVLAQLFGPMVDRPASMPMWSRDLMHLITERGVDKVTLPRQEGGHHNALADARWNRDVYRHLMAGVR
jgi:hypothetical protein